MKQEKSEYAKKLMDPRWQKKRLQVLERDSWTCQLCADDARTLHVHHLWYQRGKDPWEYPMSALLTLCSECHEEEGNSLREQESALCDAMKRCGAMSSDFNEVMYSFVAGRCFLPDGGVATVDGPPWRLIAWHIEQICKATVGKDWLDKVKSEQGEFYERYWKPFDAWSKRPGTFYHFQEQQRDDASKGDSA